MKILQWNIWYKEDIKNILKTLKEIDADIICLQELTKGHPHHNLDVGDTVAFIAEGLSYNHFYKKAEEMALDGVMMNYGNGIFSRYPISNTAVHYIQQRAEVNVKDYANVNRLYLEATVETPEATVTVGTTHMSYTDRFESTSAKEVETDALMAILNNKTEKFVFTGDLNALPGSYTIESINKQLKHAGPNMEEKSWTTKPFSYNGFEATELQWRLDYCFVTSDVNVKSAQIINTKYSDHLPILLEI